MTYLLLKWLHVIGAAMLFGTGLGIAFFTWFAYRNAMKTGNLALLQGVLVLTVIADTVFTAVSALVQPITGLLLWWMSGASWRSPWLAWVLGLYMLVGLCWLPVVVLQVRLRNAAAVARSTDDLDARFRSDFRLWFMLGWPAFVAMMLLFGLMVGRGYWM